MQRKQKLTALINYGLLVTRNSKFLHKYIMVPPKKKCSHWRTKHPSDKIIYDSIQVKIWWIANKKVPISDKSISSIVIGRMGMV